MYPAGKQLNTLVSLANLAVAFAVVVVRDHDVMVENTVDTNDAPNNRPSLFSPKTSSFACDSNDDTMTGSTSLLVS